MIIIFLLIFFVVFQKQIFANLKASFLMAQEFPQSLFKPINFLPDPKKETIIVDSKQGKIIIDMFLPNLSINKIRSVPLPVVILAIGVKLEKEDERSFLRNAKDLSKLGYIVVNSRSERLIIEDSSLESPDTFINTFKYLEKLENVDKKRISIAGFSTGASIGLIAAEDPYLNERLRSFVFFGGYYNLFDYMQSLTTKSIFFNEKKELWDPDKGVFYTFLQMVNKRKKIDLINMIKQGERRKNLNLLNSLPIDDLNELKEINPAENIKNFKTPIFIIHDINDRVIPYTESIKLYEHLPVGVKKTFILTDYFEHVRPREKIDIKFDKLIKAYMFYSKVISYL